MPTTAVLCGCQQHEDRAALRARASGGDVAQHCYSDTTTSSDDGRLPLPGHSASVRHHRRELRLTRVCRRCVHVGGGRELRLPRVRRLRRTNTAGTASASTITSISSNTTILALVRPGVRAADPDCAIRGRALGPPRADTSRWCSARPAAGGGSPSPQRLALRRGGGDKRAHRQ
jgi:hypothetical protein